MTGPRIQCRRGRREFSQLFTRVPSIEPVAHIPFWREPRQFENAWHEAQTAKRRASTPCISTAGVVVVGEVVQVRDRLSVRLKADTTSDADEVKYGRS